MIAWAVWAVFVGAVPIILTLGVIGAAKAHPPRWARTEEDEPEAIPEGAELPPLDWGATETDYEYSTVDNLDLSNMTPLPMDFWQ